MKSYLSIFLILGLTLPAYAYRPITDDKLQELVQSFQYTPTVKQIRASKASCQAQDVEFTTTYPQRDSELTIKAKSFVPVNLAVKVPVIFMLPPLGGASSLDLLIGERFCKNNLAAFIITTNLTGLNSDELVPVTDHDHTHRRVAAALKGAMIVASTYPEINIEKAGLFGISLGGILGSVAYSVIPELSAATLFVNGGDVPHILAVSDQVPIINLKKARMREQGFTAVEQYEAFLNDHLEIDPLHFAKMVNPETVKLYLSNNDKSVPTVNQIDYYNAIGKPKETKFSSLGHMETVLSVLATGTGKQQIADWFHSRFSQRNPRVGH